MVRGQALMAVHAKARSGNVRYIIFSGSLLNGYCGGAYRRAKATWTKICLVRSSRGRLLCARSGRTSPLLVHRSGHGPRLFRARNLRIYCVAKPPAVTGDEAAPQLVG